MVYRYKLIKTRYGSNRYGKCEVCKRNVNTTYHQVEEKQYRQPNGKLSWTRHSCHDLFGHKSCLIRKRRK